MKEAIPLDDLAQTFSPELVDVFLSEKDLLEKNIFF